MKKSKYVQEILQDLKDNPYSWKRFRDNSIVKDDLLIRHFGNATAYTFWTLSIVEVVIKGKVCEHLTYWDKMQLEKAYIQWMRNASIEQLK